MELNKKITEKQKSVCVCVCVCVIFTKIASKVAQDSKEKRWESAVCGEKNSMKLSRETSMGGVDSPPPGLIRVKDD